MIILIKYNNTSSKYLPTYQFLETIGRQVLHLVPSKLAFHNDGLVLAGKTFPFLHTGKIFQKRLFLVGFLWDFFYPVGNIDVQFQGLYFGLHASKMLLAPLPPDTSGGNQPPTIEYKGEKEVFLFTNNTNLAQTIQSKYLQVQVFMFIFIIIHLQPLQVHRRVIQVPIRQVFYVYLSVLRQVYNSNNNNSNGVYLFIKLLSFHRCSFSVGI